MANAKHIYQILGSVNNEQQFPQIINALTNCRYYAYIYHDSDVDSDGNVKKKHLHFVAEDRHTLKRWAEHFGLPENMIEICHNWRSANRYLIHIDDPEKAQYSAKNVFTNRPLRYQSYLEDNQELSPSCLFNDLNKVKRGDISTSDFINKYQYFLAKQSFYCQYKIYTDLVKYE